MLFVILAAFLQRLQANKQLNFNQEETVQLNYMLIDTFGGNFETDYNVFCLENNKYIYKIMNITSIMEISIDFYVNFPHVYSDHFWNLKLFSRRDFS